MFDWDRNNLRKIKAHRLTVDEVEHAVSYEPIMVYQQDADDETRFVYYGETAKRRMIAIALTERKGKIRVVTAYDLDAGQKREYLQRRLEGE